MEQINQAALSEYQKCVHASPVDDNEISALDTYLEIQLVSVDRILIDCRDK
jgi:hypothetical protein